ncbi:hybrid sensor histidine kinase/response regulator [Fulvivirga lutimaris]|uniref:hybrid sensor histidine kinase/response regulator n=1 Tax=Fulvivirga lutimaris TaxID=1819566 RepID=UPI0012BC497B|nr:hybrid sensor histidine kinase/response regulator [Fulvivirga lutimaris]MTI41788.1 hybrid sensor histidine kinase/response regulator [Fulvivirga lutimaris]
MDSIIKKPDNNKELILYVDDEVKNLDSFKIIFRREYEVLVAKSAQEGLEMLRDNEIRLVITDQRMPNMTGVEFLEKIANLYPEITRIILTGYSDMEAIISAINKGRVFRYITKPWNKDELKETIDYALEAYKLRLENKNLIKQLQKTNKELDELVYRSSHDLRAPLASVLGLINLAKKEEDLDRIREYLDLQEGSVKRLDELLKEIIQYSRNSHLEIRKDDIILNDVIRNAVDIHEYFIGSQHIKKTIDVVQTVKLYCDKYRLEIILNNLISNAIRYSNLNQPQPQLNISAKVDDNEVVIKVADNGIGINPKLKNNIFDMFYKGSDEKMGGSGLGLFIVSESIERLNGEILLDSEEGKGSVFTIKIPNNAETEEG